MDNSEKQTQLLLSFIEEWNSGEGISAFTSGSTGAPKEISLTQQQIVRSAKRTLNFFGISKKNRLHCAISFEFIGGKMMIARSLIAGCRLTFSSPSLAPSPPDGEVALMSVVAAQMPHILSHREEFATVKAFLIGGSAIDNRLWDRIVASGINAWESYGMTETASHIAIRRIVGNSDRRPRFVALPGIRLSAGPDGCLVITDGDIRVETNDLTRIFPDGSFILTGRKDDVIVSGGLKILAPDVENALRPFMSSGVAQFIIGSLPDEVWTSRLVLVCVPENGIEDYYELKKSLEQSLEFIPEQVLPRKKRPKEVYIMKNLPLTPSGKIKRHFSQDDLLQ